MSPQRAAGYLKRNLPSRKSYGTASCAEAKPAFALKRFGAVASPSLSSSSLWRRLIIPVAPTAGSTLRPEKLQGILAKANKNPAPQKERGILEVNCLL
jgi:hypothetical protein